MSELLIVNSLYERNNFIGIIFYDGQSYFSNFGIQVIFFKWPVLFGLEVDDYYIYIVRLFNSLVCFSILYLLYSIF